MRMLLALALAAFSIVAVAPESASADEVKRFEKPDLGLAFDYPAAWSLTQAQPRNVMPNEVFNVQANGNATTAFLMAVYQLPAPVTPDNLDTTFEQFDKQVQAWVAKLPGGTIVEIYDTIIDDADGREYSYEFQINGQTIYGDLILIPNGDKAVELTQWASEEEYSDQLDSFDVILGSLVLPWTDTTEDNS
jgi:hypothetical protein